MSRYDELRALAAKATPGPWTPDIVEEYHADDEPIATGWFRDGPGKVDVGDYNTLTADDACYIAAVDPQTVLGLLDEIERLRRAFLTIATEAGEDTSGIDHPDQLVTPSIEEFALQAVRSLRSRWKPR